MAKTSAMAETSAMEMPTAVESATMEVSAAGFSRSGKRKNGERRNCSRHDLFHFRHFSMSFNRTQPVHQETMFRRCGFLNAPKKPQPFLIIKAETFHGVIFAMMPTRSCSAPTPGGLRMST
jgi:hypothetical protein